MRTLVHDLLNLARLEIEGDTRPHETMDLAALLDMAAEATHHEFKARKQTLNLTKTDLSLKANAEEMTLVFTNLLVNAAKYAPEKTEIEVWAETQRKPYPDPFSK